MIAHIKGNVDYFETGCVVIDVSGVGFRISIPHGNNYEILTNGLTVKLYTHLNVTENGMDLFGFLTMAEKELFMMLTSISSFGPKLALSILSSMTVQDLAYAITAGEKNLLKKIPGLGDKKAERLILELKDKERILEMMLKQPLSSEPADTMEYDCSSVIEVLEDLGCTKAEATAAVKKVISLSGSMKSDELIVQALKVLEGR